MDIDERHAIPALLVIHGESVGIDGRHCSTYSNSAETGGRMSTSVASQRLRTWRKQRSGEHDGEEEADADFQRNRVRPQIGEGRDDEEDRQAGDGIVHDDGVREIAFLPLKAEATVVQCVSIVSLWKSRPRPQVGQRSRIARPYACAAVGRSIDSSASDYKPPRRQGSREERKVFFFFRLLGSLWAVLAVHSRRRFERLSLRVTECAVLTISESGLRPGMFAFGRWSFRVVG